MLLHLIRSRVSKVHYEQAPDNIQKIFILEEIGLFVSTQNARHFLVPSIKCSLLDNKCHLGTSGSSDPRLVWWVQARTKHRVSIKYFVDDPGDILSQAIYRWPGLTDGVWVRDIADQSEASLDPLREDRSRMYVHIISINLIISRDEVEATQLSSLFHSDVRADEPDCPLTVQSYLKGIEISAAMQSWIYSSSL